MIKYEKYEFCKAVECPELKSDETGYYHCDKGDYYCNYTAKTFHPWLKRQGFKIVKED